MREKYRWYFQRNISITISRHQKKIVKTINFVELALILLGASVIWILFIVWGSIK